MNDVIVGVDRSDTAFRAAEKAAELANAVGANLHVVMCIERARQMEITSGSDRFFVDPYNEAQGFLTELSRRLSAKECTTAVVEGDPAGELCNEAERVGAQVIVVGNKRVQGAARVLGSIAGAVARNAPCDVYIAHTH